MKRVCSVLLAAVFVCCLWLPAAAEDDLIDRDNPRFNDLVGVVSKEENALLNEKALAQIDELQMDMPVYVFYRNDNGTPLSEYADDFYELRGFGYGEDKSGVMLVFDFNSALFNIFCYGEAKKMIGDDVCGMLSDTFKNTARDDDLTFYDAFDRYYDELFRAIRRAHQYLRTTETQTSSDGALPYWYPDEIEGFQDFHGKDLPPVVDDAHILTDEQFLALCEKISLMNERLGIGYVALTSNDNYGFTPEEFSSDFLHYNGYGVGDDYGAVVFYLCFEPGNRCWRTTSINETYESLFNFDVTYEIDELVDSSIRSGDYFDAFMIHADYVERMFTNMTEDLPDWYPAGTRTYALDRDSRTYAAKPNPEKPRVADNAGFLTDTQKKTVGDALQSLCAQYGIDLLIFTDSSVRTPRPAQYAEDYYYYNGYAGDGICLYMFGSTDPQIGALYYGAGTAYEKLNIASRLTDVIIEKTPDQQIERYVEMLTFMLEHNRLPMRTATSVFCLIVGIVIGLIVASLMIDRLKDSMRITQTVSAQSYLVDGSFRLLRKNTHYLYSTVTKRAKPKDTGSSSGSSHSSRGGSSYSSGRSSGGSYSSGGRSF